jgi:hypothetical protein
LLTVTRHWVAGPFFFAAAIVMEGGRRKQVNAPPRDPYNFNDRG